MVDKANTHVRYKDKNVSEEERLAHLKAVEKDLFGNDTDLGDSLHVGSAVTVPGKATLH
mgnify:CR=1 FL=1